MAYLMAAIVMTLSVLEGHSLIASLFKYEFWYLWHVESSLCICIASCSDWITALLDVGYACLDVAWCAYLCVGHMGMAAVAA